MSNSNVISKASRKMFPDFGPSVQLEQASGGTRLTREEREELDRKRELEARVREEMEKEMEREMEAKEPKEEQPSVEIEEEHRGVGRPRKYDQDNTVQMTFRVSKEFRKKLKVVSFEKDMSILDIFTEAIEEWIEKNCG